MKKDLIVKLISGLLIVLFIYASLSKLMDYRTFTLQLHHSPLLRGHEMTISWLIPSMEILAAILLLFQVTRVTGLLVSFLLMTLFTGYIGFMLASNQNLPCSCGGILQGMSWKAHLIFNCIFLLITGSGIYLYFKSNELMANNSYHS